MVMHTSRLVEAGLFITPWPGKVEGGGRGVGEERGRGGGAVCALGHLD